jgi:hypothetical protein
VSADDVKTAGSVGGKAGGKSGGRNGGKAGGRSGDEPISADGIHVADPGGQIASLVMGWIEDVQASNREHLEAELDRASFESFPASDPVAPASTNQRASTLRLECLVSDDRLTFRRTARSDDSASPERGAPYDRLELETPDGMVIIVEVRRDNDTDEERLDPLELPPEHASIVSRQDERRSGEDRRMSDGQRESPANGQRNERRSGDERRAQ